MHKYHVCHDSPFLVCTPDIEFCTPENVNCTPDIVWRAVNRLILYYIHVCIIKELYCSPDKSLNHLNEFITVLLEHSNAS